MKLSLAKTFLILLVAGVFLLTLIAMDPLGLPEPLPTLRFVLGILFILLVPGFSLQAALFPRRADLDPLARVAFSIGLSIAVIPPIFLAINALGVGVQFLPVAAAIGSFVVLCAVVALVRRRRLPEDEKTGMTISLDVKGWWSSQDRISRWLYSILVVALCTAAISAILVSQERPDEHFTEFYILDTQGLSEDYPRETIAGASIDINFGITNREGEFSQYNIVAVRGEEQALANSGPISLADGETWQGKLTIVLAQPGDGQKVEFFLERIGSPWPYRTLRIWMNVDPAGGTTPTLKGTPGASL